jgi:hypothetical protein
MLKEGKILLIPLEEEVTLEAALEDPVEVVE